MHDLSIETLKQMNLAEFLSRHYGLSFRRCGAVYQCRSPFTDEKKPSFFVRLVEGHWLFKDFSSGAGGSVSGGPCGGMPGGTSGGGASGGLSGGISGSPASTV